MPTAVFMPKFEMTQQTGQIVTWLKEEGQPVEKGEPILEVETDKATLEVEAPASGTLAAITGQPGQVIPIGTPIAYILKPGESLSSLKPAETVGPLSLPEGEDASAPAAGPGSHVRATPVAARLAAAEGVALAGITGSGAGGRINRADVEAALAAAPGHAGPEGKVSAVPAARRLARELGIDLATALGTGPGGRIQSADVWRTAQAASAAVQAPIEQAAPVPVVQPGGGLTVRCVVPLTSLRRTIAERMTASVREAPQFSLSVDANMRRAIEFVDDLKAGAGDGRPKVTLTALLVKVCAWALRQHPEVNATFRDDGIVEWDEVNVGIATAIDQGLIVPVVHGADTLGLRSIAERVAELAGRARENKSRLDDLQGGTFTLSNLGMLGIDRFTAILNPPQAAILAVGRVVRRAEVNDDDQVEIRPMACLTLTADHRVLDGATAARFLATVQRGLEHPGLLLD